MEQKVYKSKHGINKRSKQSQIMMGIVIGIVVLLLVLVYLLFFRTNSKNIGRCSTDEININQKIVTKVESKIKEIEQVDSVKIQGNVCIVKIIVNLTSDVELDTLKSKMTESLKEFDTSILENYDIELFVTSDNKDSETYPLIVSKHKSQKDFYWE